MIKIRNITLSADNEMIEQARQKARKEQKSLNAKFREWLNKYVNPKNYTQNYEEFMSSLEHVSAGRKFSRDEANER